MLSYYGKHYWGYTCVREVGKRITGGENPRRWKLLERCQLRFNADPRADLDGEKFAETG